MDIHVRRMALNHGRSEGHCALTTGQKCGGDWQLSRTLQKQRIVDEPLYPQGIFSFFLEDIIMKTLTQQFTR